MSSLDAISRRITDRIMSARVARQHVASDETRALLEDALGYLKKYRAWSATFQSTLKDAQRSSQLGDDVWQDEFIEFWEPFTSIQRELLALYDALAELNPHVAERIEPDLDPPARAQIEYATELTKFLDRPGYDRAQIVYDIQRLQAWHKNFTSWVAGAITGVRAVITKL